MGFFVKINNNTIVTAIKQDPYERNLDEPVSDSVQVRTVDKYVLNSEWQRARLSHTLHAARYTLTIHL